MSRTTFVPADVPSLRQSWLTECIDCPKQFHTTNRSLRLDRQDRPHIAYGSRNLYYAWYDGNDWVYETADPTPDVGGQASLALDGQGQANIAYYDSANLDLKYAHRDAGGWHTATVDSQGDVGRYTSIDLDPSGRPHISYYDDTNGDLKYAHHNSAGCQIQVVGSAGDAGEWSSLALDRAGFPTSATTTPPTPI